MAINVVRGWRWWLAVIPLIAVASCTESANCLSGNPLMPLCVGDGQDEPRLVFVSNRDWPGREDLGDVYTMTSRGTNLRRLTTSGMAELPRWSPNGREIVFHEYAADFPQTPRVNLMIISADGSNPRNISGGALVIDGFAAWSPDGHRIVFHSNRHNPQGGAQRSVYVMNADGSNIVRLTTNDAWIDRSPHWSPDGTRIAFMSNRIDGMMQIFVMNADGSDQRQLTSEGFNQWPNWSPDGRKIVFSSQRIVDGDFDNGLYIINADGTGETNLTKGVSMVDMHSTWSGDGSEIYFCSGRNGMHIYRVAVSAGLVRPVTNPGSMSMEMMPNAKWPVSFAASLR